MTRIIALALAITAGGFATGFAAASEGTLDMARADEIKAELTAQGYEVRKVEIEDGLYEAYALKDGQRFEIYLDADLNVVKTEADD